MFYLNDLIIFQFCRDLKLWDQFIMANLKGILFLIFELNILCIDIYRHFKDKEQFPPAEQAKLFSIQHMWVYIGITFIVIITLTFIIKMQINVLRLQ